uniref:NADH-ubiquinone oxidoreductase chain 3 n=1 Tax=Graffilla buccinicola TaxID=84095 RepID=A0A7G5XUJ4_9PLAT|nr:NADH dehydrogenase subunit 3 [Graffilla buccinicola]QNA49629.1 NADH dehydrogenase subunit 3 [Graffilla buccinicola]
MVVLLCCWGVVGCVLAGLLGVWYVGVASHSMGAGVLAPFECGFGGLGGTVFYSVRFYYLLVLFLVFDVELILLLQLVVDGVGGVWSAYFLFSAVVWFVVWEVYCGVLLWKG